MKNVLTNWKTTLIGLIIVGGLAYKAFTVGFEIEEVIMGLIAVGFLVAKDGDKSHTKDFKAVGGELPPDDDEEGHPPG